MIKVDAMGDICPIPVVKTKKAIEKATQNEKIIVMIDNEASMENLIKMASEMKYEHKGIKIDKDHYKVEIIKGKNSDLKNQKPIEKIYNVQKNENIVIVISSNKMGRGDDKLGQILMKAFIYALTEAQKLPSAIIFYNGGAKLAVCNSPVINSLKKLEQLGVEVLTCGTCANYYGITDQIKVGRITNMYDIVEKMNNADKIIKP